MFDQVDNQLEKWIKSVHDKIEVTFAPPNTVLSKVCVCSYLLDAAPNSSRRGNNHSPLQITLRYLVVPFAQEPQESHRILGELLVAALENKEFEIEKEPFPLAAWSVFGISPRPSFILRVQFKIDRSAKFAPIVRHPLVLQPSPLETMHGEILGAGNLPIMNARVEIPELNLSTLTDYQGRFHFFGVPSEPRVKRLFVRAKGRAFSVNTDKTKNADEKLIIHLQLEE
jgi:hypothetical protein